MVRVAVLAVVIGAVAALLAPIPAAGAEPFGAVSYEHPVDAEIVDRFRLPSTPFGPGNRGVKYGTEPGDDIRAAADGVVIFAGQAGGALHVTVQHRDGRLTSYSGVGEILVRLHQAVDAGELVARAGGVLHVGVREDGQYVDPELLFDVDAVSVRLIPESPVVGDGWRTPGQEAAELARVAWEIERPGRFGRLGSALGRVGGWGGAILRGAADGALTAFDLARIATSQYGQILTELWQFAPYALGAFNPVVSGVVFGLVLPLLSGEVPPLVHFALDRLLTPKRVWDQTVEWWRHRDHCTPGDVVPDPPSERRIAVLVGGLDSTSDNAAIGNVQVEALGYGESDVVGFSYAGGRTPGRFDGGTSEIAGDLRSVEVTDYGRQDSSTDLGSRGVLLADLLADIADASPGTTIDLFAHSQGGLVTRLAMAELMSRPGGEQVVESLGLVATIATPHQGSDLATMSVALSSGLSGSIMLGAADWITGSTMHPGGTNVSDLQNHSELLRQLNAAGLAEGPSYLSVGNTEDMVVTNARARLDGATHVTVGGGGIDAHSTVTSQPATTRELALALVGLPPTCRAFGAFVVDLVAAEANQHVVSTVGLAASVVSVPIVPLDVLEPHLRW